MQELMNRPTHSIRLKLNFIKPFSFILNQIPTKMTAFQRISASIKRRRNSLFERPNTPTTELEEFGDEQKILQEAKTFISQQQQGAGKNMNGNGFIGVEELKTLRFLCDMLESSLNSTSPPNKEQLQNSNGKRNRSGSTAFEGGGLDQQQQEMGGYTTWAAGAAQGQRHLLMKSMMMAKQQQQQQQQQQKRKISTGIPVAVEMDTIQEEEHEIVPTATTMEGVGSTLNGLDEIQQEEAMNIDQELGEKDLISYKEPEPLHVKILPHIAMIIFVICYLFLGSFFYQCIDPEIGQKSSPRAFIWAFQLLATIGWGDSHASTTFSQAFTVLYILFGIPMLFSIYANFGRLVTEFFCRQGPKNWHKLIGIGGKKEQNGEEEVQRLPLMVIANLLVFHQCIGLIIYSIWLKDWPVISTIYFSITTMATSGFGDFHPDTDSWMETIVAILYISTGIVLLSAFFLTIALYYQAFHYIQLKVALAKLYGQFVGWKKGIQNEGNNSQKEQTGK